MVFSQSGLKMGGPTPQIQTKSHINYCLPVIDKRNVSIKQSKDTMLVFCLGALWGEPKPLSAHHVSNRVLYLVPPRLFDHPTLPLQLRPSHGGAHSPLAHARPFASEPVSAWSEGKATSPPNLRLISRNPPARRRRLLRPLPEPPRPAPGRLPDDVLAGRIHTSPEVAKHTRALFVGFGDLRGEARLVRPAYLLHESKAGNGEHSGL